MRKSLVLVSCLSLLMAGACNKFEAENSAAVENAAASGSTLMAYIPGATKTAFGETVGTETKMNWTEGDKLYVMGESDWLNPHKYTLVAASAGSSTGMFTSADPTTETGNIAAFYPYSWSGQQSFYNQITIPTSQTSATLGAGVMPMYGKGTVEDGLTFEHLGSILRLKLYTQEEGKTLSKILVNNGSTISGRYYTTKYSDALRVATGEMSSVSYSNINQPLSTDPSDPTVVDILIMAKGGKTLSNFSISVVCSDGSTFTKTMAGTKTVAAGSIVTFSALECSFSLPSMQISYDGGSNWLDYEGTVSIPDECTDIVVKNANCVLTTEDLKILKSAIVALPIGRNINLDLSDAIFESTTWPSTFSLVRRIANIKLPNNIESLASRSFEHCLSLNEVTLPANCKKVAEFALRGTEGHFAVAEGNTSLKIIGGSLYSYDGKNFICADYGKDEITIQEGVVTVSMSAFMGDNKLKSLTLTSTIKSIGSYFAEMNNLATIDASSLSIVPSFGGFLMDNLKDYPGYAVSTDKKIIVAAGMVDAFSTAAGWKVFLTPTPAEGAYTSWTPWEITSDGL